MIEELISMLEREFKERVKVYKDRGRYFVVVEPSDLKRVVKLAVERGFNHLITISGVDAGDHFEVVYHLKHGGEVLNLKVKVDKGNPRVPSVTEVIPGAVLYEYEVFDLFGVVPEGNEPPGPLVLPEGWPREVHPLHKEFKEES
ncbi:MAG: NADH-quinone oxidoreductase subunit C [Candidatus Verstraetearchaeota archaeon]|nr:NADH-quinone oxidoreductase subunit C [Candidatus Verstraetearchaeota archaeon]